VLAATALAKNIVAVVDQDDLFVIGTRFVATKAFPNVTVNGALAACHAVVVRDGSSESDGKASSLRFGFNEKYFRSFGFRLCTPYELLTVAAVTPLADGTYPTYNSPDGDDLNAFVVENGNLVNERELQITGDLAYTDRVFSAVCCCAAQFQQVGEGSK
jgi:hypothetical protein